MNRISVKVKADSWLTTAAKEIRRIQTRWGIPSQRKFAVLLGVNGRTLAKLYADPPDESLTYGSVQQMFSNLMISVWTEFNTTEDVNQELKLLNGNPAKVIGYRFEPEQIAALNKIRWWNWTAEKVRAASELLLDEIDSFIERYLPQAEQEIARIPQIEINPIEKILTGEDKRLLYIPDFEQDYPTYPRVIDAFVSSYANTNCELLLYVKEDAFVPDKLAVLDRLFEQYADVDCYVNVYVGNLEDERGLFAQNDAYITNRSLDNVRHMDMADFYGIPVISSVNLPIFTEQDVQGMCKL